MIKHKKRKTTKQPDSPARRNSSIAHNQKVATTAQRDNITRLHKQGKHAEVCRIAKQLTQSFPDDAFIWATLGSSLCSLARYEEALIALQKANELYPNDYIILDAIAQIYARQGDIQNAINIQRQCLKIEPNYPAGHYHLATYLHEIGLPETLNHLKKAEELGFDQGSILALRGATQTALLLFNEALSTFRTLLEKFPELPETHNNIANIYKDLGDFEKAEYHYRKALEIDKEYATAYSNLFFTMHYDPKNSAEKILEFAKERSKFFSNKKISKESRPARKENIRIGLLSGGLRRHPVGQMIISGIKYTKEPLEFYAYSTTQVEDSISEKFKKKVACWKNIGHLNPEELAREIHKDEIDILIDLSGHGSGSRLESIAMQPAPVIVKWVGGLVSSMGIESFDYLISDKIETPIKSDYLYTEKLIRMPDDYICYLPSENMPPVAMLPAISNGYITLGCFNNPAKINPILLAEWAVLMHKLPNCRLLLKGAQYDSPEFCERIRGIMNEHGICDEHLILEGPANHEELLATYNRIDIALDPWPYSGGLTTCEAMLMGVPVVTLPGPTFAGRHSATHLVNAGMPELVVDSWDQYRQRVIELASDLPNLSVIRACLRRVLIESPVCDGPRFARHFTTAMRAIWHRHCEGKAPAALTLDKDGSARFEDEDSPVALIPLAQKSTETPSVDETFQWGIEGKIITLDHGAILTSDPIFAELQRTDTFATITFDPTSKVINATQLQQAIGELHHYPQVALGDGHESTLFICADSAMSATLLPLPAEQQLLGNKEATQVIAKLSIPTLRLDDIEGLESIDWLLLDNMNDSLEVLENGEKLLTNTLLVHARVNFAQTHKLQPTLTKISHWLEQHGFSFYRLHNFQHYSHLPARDDLLKQQASQLVSADAIFIPSPHRLENLSPQQKTKLAFILHTAYEMHDLAFRLLTEANTCEVEKYLEDNGYLNKPRKPLSSTQPSRIYINHGRPKACIGIPAYNEEKYIQETIHSLKEQDIDGVKFIISDNASSDQTFEIAKDLSSDDARFELIRHHQNLGAAENFFKLFKESESDYFMWLGAHDYLSENYLNDVINILDQDNGVSMACGLPFGVMDGRSFGPVQQAIYDLTQQSPAERYIKSVAELTNCTIFHSLFRRKDLEGLSFRKTISFDHVLISRLLWAGRLQYAKNSYYFRRYFEPRNTATEERILGNKERLDRKDFFEFYGDDLKLLLQSANTSQQSTHALLEKVQAILKARFPN